MDQEGLLPWEGDGAPEGVGVCLSGGGVRAACFALGAIQALQAERGLLFGPKSADYLSVVSGGSYTGGALLLNASAMASSRLRPTEPAPLANGSPESEHILNHGTYLLEGGPLQVARRFLQPGVFNVAAFVMIFAWAGTMVATYASVGDEATAGGTRAVSGDVVWLVALGALLGGGFLLRGLYIDGGWRRAVFPLVGLGMIFLCGPSLIEGMERLAPLSETSWWWPWSVAVAVITAALLAGIWGAVSRLGSAGAIAARAVLRVALIAVRVLGLVLFSLVTTAAFDFIQDGIDDSGVATVAAYLGVLLGGVLMSPVSSLVSLHRPYRDRLAACFGVRRDGSRVTSLPPLATALSSLAPPRTGDTHRFPRLLVSATANVRWRRPDGTRQTFAPFVFSHDRCGIPGQAGASLSTERLEAGRTTTRFSPRAEESILSLMTAVATTGAAVSPGMGRMTVPAVRPLFAIANIRLGRWLPNPLSGRARERVEDSTGEWPISKPKGFGSGYDEFVPELLGLHRSDNPRVYVSDGGHYDNLGLLTLLRARCSTVWCVDSEADRDGEAGQLRDALELARAELNIAIELDADVFKGANGTLGASHAVGRIDYGNGQSGCLVVIKLGLTDRSPPALRDYQRVDKRFPFHSTFMYPAFARPRADAYRSLGSDNALAASRAEATERV